MSIQRLEFNYEIMGFGDAFPQYSEASIEEKEELYQKIKEAFKNLIEDSPSTSTKIQFDDQNRKVLCSCKNGKELKAEFPNIKKFIKISSWVNSTEPNVVNAYALPSPEQREKLDKEEKILKKQQQEDFNKFKVEVELFYKTASFPPSKPIKLENDLTSKELITQLLKQADGFGIGDTHHEISAALFVISHMEDFKKQGVTTFFWEGFPEHLEKQVEKYFDPKNPVDRFPKKLAECLKKQGEFLTKNIYNDSSISEEYKNKAENIFFEFFKALKTNGIKLKTLEIREYCEIGPMVFGKSKHDAEDNVANTRMKPMNYLAQKFIRTFKKEHPGEKYIYWDGFHHNRTSGSQVTAPGIPELTGDPWILISDVKDKSQIINTNTPDGKKVLNDKFKGHCPTGKMFEPAALLLLNPEKESAK